MGLEGSAKLAVLNDKEKLNSSSSTLGAKMSTTTDPRVAEILRKRVTRTRVLDLKTSIRGPRCETCLGQIKPGRPCRRCHPDLVVEVPEEKLSPGSSVDPRPSIEAYREHHAREFQRIHGRRLEKFDPERETIRLRRQEGRRLHEHELIKCPELIATIKAAILAILERGKYPSFERVRAECGLNDNIRVFAAIRDGLLQRGEVEFRVRPCGSPLNPKGRFSARKVDYPVEVKAAVESLIAKGVYPSIDLVLATIGRGALSSISHTMRDLKAAGLIPTMKRPASRGRRVTT
jgi:hypothetical protein